MKQLHSSIFPFRRAAWRSLMAVLAMGLVMMACTKSMEDVIAENTVSSSSSTSDDLCYLTSVTLGQLKRVVTTTTSAGKDTTYTITFSGSYYPLAVDQRRQTVTMVDSLPVGTKLDAVLVTASFQGALFYTHAADTSEWTAYSSTDSIDFTQPVVFRVYNSKATSHRDYAVSMRVRQYEPTNYTWQQLDWSKPLAEAQSLGSLYWGGRLYLAGRMADGTVRMERSDEVSLQNWSSRTLVEVPCVGASNAEVQSLCAFNDHLWMSTTDGRLLCSSDGSEWSATVQTVGPLALIGASAQRLYARVAPVDAAPYVASSVDGLMWERIAVEDSDQFAGRTSSVAYVQSNGNSRVLAAVTPEGDGEAVRLWSLLEGWGEAWTHFEPSSDNPYILPRASHLCLVSYDELLIAFTSTGLCYVSRDNGITWKTEKQLVMPASMQTSITALTATVVGEYVWLCTGQQLWRVRYNSFGS